MRMGYLGRLSGAAALAALFAATPAAACGSGVLMTLLFTVYPESEDVVRAETHAIALGTLRGALWTPDTGLAMHEWRAEKAAGTVDAVRARLEGMPASPAISGTAQVFLIHEFQWMVVDTRPGAARAHLRPFSSVGEGPRFFTTRHVLDNVLAGTLAWDEAVASGLIRSSAPEAERAAWLGIIGQAFGNGPAQAAAAPPAGPQTLAAADAAP